MEQEKVNNNNVGFNALTNEEQNEINTIMSNYANTLVKYKWDQIELIKQTACNTLDLTRLDLLSN